MPIVLKHLWGAEVQSGQISRLSGMTEEALLAVSDLRGDGHEAWLRRAVWNGSSDQERAKAAHAAARENRTRAQMTQLSADLARTFPAINVEGFGVDDRLGGTVLIVTLDVKGKSPQEAKA